MLFGPLQPPHSDLDLHIVEHDCHPLMWVQMMFVLFGHYAYKAGELVNLPEVANVGIGEIFLSNSEHRHQWTVTTS